MYVTLFLNHDIHLIRIALINFLFRNAFLFKLRLLIRDFYFSKKYMENSLLDNFPFESHT